MWQLFSQYQVVDPNVFFIQSIDLWIVTHQYPTQGIEHALMPVNLKDRGMIQDWLAVHAALHRGWEHKMFTWLKYTDVALQNSVTNNYWLTTHTHVHTQYCDRAGSSWWSSMAQLIGAGHPLYRFDKRVSYVLL